MKDNRDRWRLWYWDKHSASYDREMRLGDRVLFGRQSRAWVCSARQWGHRFEGCGRWYRTQLRLYPRGSDHGYRPGASSGCLQSPAAKQVNVVTLSSFAEADAHALVFPGASRTPLSASFWLCAIPDDRRAVAEMKRVLRPGGRLPLADHVAGSPVARPRRPTTPRGRRHGAGKCGEHRLDAPGRPGTCGKALEMERQQRFAKLGIVERLAARKAERGSPS